MVQYGLKHDLFRLPALRIQAQCLVAQAYAQPKPAKELACQTHRRLEEKVRNAKTFCISNGRQSV